MGKEVEQQHSLEEWRISQEEEWKAVHEELQMKKQQWRNTIDLCRAANEQRQSEELVQHLQEVESGRHSILERGWKCGRLCQAYTGGQFQEEEEEEEEEELQDEAAATRKWLEEQEELRSNKKLQAAAAASSSSSSKWQEAPGDEETARAAVEDPPDWGDKATEDGQPPYFAN